MAPLHELAFQDQSAYPHAIETPETESPVHSVTQIEGPVHADRNPRAHLLNTNLNQFDQLIGIMEEQNMVDQTATFVDGTGDTTHGTIA